MEMFYQKLMEFGLSGCIFAGFLIVLKWAFTSNQKILDNMLEERQSAQEVIRGFAENVKENSASSAAFARQIEEAHRYQRDEHKEMIDILKTINNRVN